MFYRVSCIVCDVQEGIDITVGLTDQQATTMAQNLNFKGAQAEQVTTSTSGLTHNYVTYSLLRYAEVISGLCCSKVLLCGTESNID